jgi:hypothetical protein
MNPMAIARGLPFPGAGIGMQLPDIVPGAVAICRSC